jgi:hypothetical protein
VEVCYRNAALWYGERRLAKALVYGLLASAIKPSYTLRRLFLQRFARRDGVAQRVVES